jgi:glycosyltransferase involved in cell wall biosynthesis
MHIALYHNLPSGGAKRLLFNQVLGLKKRGHTFEEYILSSAEVEFLAITPFIDARHVFEVQTFEWYRNRIPLLTPYIHAAQGLHFQSYLDKLQKEIANKINQAEFDLAFIHDCQFTTIPHIINHICVPKVLYLNSLPLSRQVRKPNNKPRSIYRVIKSLYYFPAECSHRFRIHRIDLANLRAVHAILINSQYAAKWMKDHYGIDCVVVYPGIDTEQFRPLDIEKEDYLLAVGSLTRGKGYRFLVSALNCIPFEFRPKLVIAANFIDLREEQTILDVAKNLGVKLEIKCIRNDIEMTQMYNKARLLLFAPYDEPLGFAALEAMACGTPVIGVNEGGLIETIKHGETGLLVDRNPHTFASGILTLLNNLDYREKMGQAGINYVKKNWTWDKTIDNLESIFQTVIANYDK